MGVAKSLYGQAVEMKLDIRMTPAELAIRLENKQFRVLKKQGAYTRTSMQRSMRYTSKPDKRSKPGQPPLAHRSKGRRPLLRQFTVYEVDVHDKSVTTGPKLLGRNRRSSKPTPQLLNEGGVLRPDPAAFHDGGVELGKPGPIRYLGTGRFAYATLQTDAQLWRSMELIAEENSVREMARTTGVTQHIAPRPFTAPVLTDGGDNLRKLIAREPL